MGDVIVMSCRKCDKTYAEPLGDLRTVDAHRPGLLRIFRRHLSGVVTKLDGTKETRTFCEATEADMVIEVRAGGREP